MGPLHAASTCNDQPDTAHHELLEKLKYAIFLDARHAPCVSEQGDMWGKVHRSYELQEVEACHTFLRSHHMSKHVAFAKTLGENRRASCSVRMCELSSSNDPRAE